MAGKKTKSAHDRFWTKVVVKGPNDCWPWIAGTSRKGGYGRFRIDQKTVAYAHRYLFAITHKIVITEANVILHTCDNPKCCNPKHLVLGTQIDNLRDMVLKGRHACGRGERHGSAKLTAVQVQEIRDSTESNTALAERYGVKQHTISNIRTGETWANSTSSVQEPKPEDNPAQIKMDFTGNA